MFFYFLGFLPLAWEKSTLHNPGKIILITKDLKGKKSGYNSEEKTLLVFTFFYFLWTVLGLFTFQWPLFSLLIVMGIVPKKSIWWIIPDAFLSILIILFIMVNSQLRINLLKLIF